MTAKMVFSGTTVSVVQVGGLANAVGAGGQNTLDNSTNLYPFARAVLKCPNSFAAAPTANSTFDFYMADSASSNPATGTLILSAQYVGSFVMYPVQQAQTRVLTVVSIEGVRSAKFYVYNNSGQLASASVIVELETFSYQDA